MLHRIPCAMMRGGTSKALVFLADDLPSDSAERNAVLLRAMGSPDARQIDGAGGGDPLTSKVAIIGRPTDPSAADINYLFAQVSLDRPIVDTTPNCGNILAAVGPFAIEAGLVKPRGAETLVRVFNINTNSVVEVYVPTPHGEVTYEGETTIDGVPFPGSAIKIDFRDAVGSKTKMLLPTGLACEEIDGVPVSCVDMAMPMLLIPAEAVGKTGYESKAELDADTALLARIEALRQKASLRMGLGDATDRVVPKMALIASPQHGSGVSSRYFMPFSCHAAHAVTGAVCIAAAAGIEGSIVHRLARISDSPRRIVRIEHPSGFLDVEMETEGTGPSTVIRRAAVLRTARRLFDGHVLVPSSSLPAAARLAAETAA
ncbi:4-oxalomesaconate tautomerase [Azospirillum sp.]|uniref:4-oxalomesaconate tautomerase n=1 Tax=Azospirillum sp. TaxID=34012 RepID=UPI002D228AEB|nr:4-oxalomesaconate tautomerase [Azospirillum sp.]HYD66557.1 4-oxalomesaconate tautomerase [Azospirillum sp.]